MISSKNPTITNWTRNPKNCKTIERLLKGCISKHRKVSELSPPCRVYVHLLLECKNTDNNITISSNR